MLHFAFSQQRPDALLKDQKPNRAITFDELRDIITGPFPPVYDDLPALARRVYQDNDDHAKRLLSEAKKNLPYFLASGFCPIHHDNETLQYNGCLQIDIDLKTTDGDRQAAAILRQIVDLKPTGVLLATISPSTFGVKILLQTSNHDKHRHDAAARAAIKHLSRILSVAEKHFDRLGASQPCYIPYERQAGTAFFNPDTGVFQIAFKDDDHAVDGPADRIEYPTEIVREAAQYLIDGKHDVASKRDDYLRILAACKNAFGDDGLQEAKNILQNSAAFLVSNFARSIDRTFKKDFNRQNGKLATGGTLVYIARERGFKPSQDRAGRTISAKKGERLTDTLQREGIPLQDVIGKYVVAPTGSGKTWLVAAIAQETNSRVVLVVPLTGLATQISIDNGATMFAGKQTHLTGDEKFIVVTQKSFLKLSGRIDLQAFDVFFDEAHNFTTDTARQFKADDLRTAHRIAKRSAKSITYLTGTDLPNFHSAFKNVERLTISRPISRPQKAYIYDASNIQAAVVEAVNQSVEKGRFPIVLLNDKKMKLTSLSTALSRHNVATLNADSKDVATYKSITENRKIPEGIDAIITTTVLREGVSIDRDERAFDFIIVGQHHSSTTVQLSARVRDAAEIAVYIIKGAKRKKDDHDFNPYKFAYMLRKSAQAFCDEHNAQATNDDTELLFKEYQARMAIQGKPVHPDDNGALQVCDFLLNNEVYQFETGIEYRDDAYLADALRRYGFTVKTDVDRPANFDHDDETKARIREASTAYKNDSKAAHDHAIETLQAAVNPLALIEQAQTAGTRAPKVYGWASTLVYKHGIPISDAIELLRDVRGGRAFKLLVNRLTVHALRSNDDYMANGRIFSIVLQAIYHRIRPGTYTADQIRQALIDCLKLDRSIDVERIDTRRAVDLSRMFFEVTGAGLQSKSEAEGYRNRVFTIKEYRLSVSHPHHHATTKTAEKQIAKLLSSPVPF